LYTPHEAAAATPNVTTAAYGQGQNVIDIETFFSVISVTWSIEFGITDNAPSESFGWRIAETKLYAGPALS
jgi:hypothetical protein